LNDLIDEVMRLVRFELQRQGVQITTIFADLPLVSADSAKLKQVVINLLMNAVQAMPGGGAVTVTTRRHGKRHVELQVRDTGPGIPDELRDSIFNPFFTTKPEGEGTGLGLYICRNIVREHGGEILVESPAGAGATFTVRLPVA
jgi:signal transduction histidine kinase